MKLITRYFLVFLLLNFYTSNAQEKNNEFGSKAVKLYAKAMSLISDGSLADAIKALDKVIELEPNYVDAYLSLAGVYGEKKDYTNAVKYYEQVISKDTNYTKIFLLPYSINLAGQGKFEEALATVNKFLAIQDLNERSYKAATYRKKCFEFAIDYKQKHPNQQYNFEPINLGDSVNTVRPEYYPTLSISDTLLVFSRMTNKGEDFEISKLSNNVFSLAETVDGNINVQALKGAATVSSDGEYLIYAGDFQEKGYGSYDLYISYYTPDGWSEPQNLGDNINTPYWESSPSISPDSRTLYFSSDRPGGLGGRDLYKSTKLPNGKWGKAVNMGSTINTLGNDLYPYIHADNQTLYYTSDGLPGYGATDLFITRKIDFDEWSQPENLGFPVNTIEDEGSICISSDGKTAFYASERSDTRGGLDLYKFELRDDIKPYKTLFVKGFIKDSKTQKGIPCGLELIDNNTNKVLMKVSSDEMGFYFMPLPSGKDYTFIVDRKGYVYFSEVYELSKEKSDSTYLKNILLQPIELNTAKVFNNVQFQTNSFTLEPISKIELDKLIQSLTENVTLKVEIIGHTDNIGKAEDNIKLSTNRAKAVVDYMISKGITASRLTYKGMGSNKPLADNNTEERRRKNRRTEFVIIGL